LTPTHATNRVYVYGNHALVNLAGLDNVATVAGEVQIEYNPVLESLSGLGALTSIGALRLMVNASLRNLAGLENLSYVGDDDSTTGFAISGNDALVSVDGLSSLTSMDAYLTLQRNNALTSLRGFAPLKSINGFFAFSNNASLPTCEVEWLHDRITGIVDLDTIVGNDDAGVCPP
jgi:hypothetical protein